MRAEDAFHSGDVLRVLEPGENVQVVLRLDQGPTFLKRISLLCVCPLFPFHLPVLFVLTILSLAKSQSKTYSVSSTFFVVARCARMAIMRARASERLMECTFWNSPSLRSEVASSSPPICSRALEVGEPPGMVTRRILLVDIGTV